MKFAVLSVSSPPSEISASVGERAVRGDELAVLRRVGEVGHRLDRLAGVGARGPQDDRALVADAGDQVAGQPQVVLPLDERAGRIVALEVGVAVEEADDLGAGVEKRQRRRRDDRVRRGGGPPREEHADLPDLPLCCHFDTSAPVGARC